MLESSEKERYCILPKKLEERARMVCERRSPEASRKGKGEQRSGNARRMLALFVGSRVDGVASRTC